MKTLVSTVAAKKLSQGFNPRLAAVLAGTAMMGAVAGGVQAATITETLAAYYNDPVSSGFPLNVTIGSFADFTIPSGDAIVGASISGYFGTNDSWGTAAVDLYLNGVAVGSCAVGADCFLGDVPPMAWSHTFTSGELASLASGHATLTGVQQSASQINLDTTTLSITTAPVPEPEPVVLLGAALPVIWMAARRRSASRSA